jgi:hypothetical protein
MCRRCLSKQRIVISQFLLSGARPLKPGPVAYVVITFGAGSLCPYTKNRQKGTFGAGRKKKKSSFQKKARRQRRRFLKIFLYISYISYLICIRLFTITFGAGFYYIWCGLLIQMVRVTITFGAGVPVLPLTIESGKGDIWCGLLLHLVRTVPFYYIVDSV